MHRRSWGLGAIAGLSGALSLGISCSGTPGGVVDQCTSQIELPAAVSTDILFVIDNSTSMSEEQAKVVEQLSIFLDSLANAPIENDFQVGVVSTSVTMHSQLCGQQPELVEAEAEAGRLQLGKDLEGETRAESTRKLLRFDDADLLEQFGLLIGQGTVGLGQEMGLEAMRRALTEPLISRALDAAPAGNQGFLRPGSRLLVVIVSDEDDCSTSSPEAVLLRAECRLESCNVDADCGAPGAYCVPVGDGGSRSCLVNSCETPAGRAALEPVSNYVDFLLDLDDGTGTGRGREVSLAVVGPVDADGQPQRCRSVQDEAFGAGERYREAIDAMGDRGFIGSICSDDYGATLRQIAELVAAPQVLELPESPIDGNLIRLRIDRPGSEPIECRNGDGFRFEAASGDAPARLEMLDRCRLRGDDQIDVSLICAG